MLNYDIRSLVKHPPARPVVLQGIQVRIAADRGYNAAITTMLKAIMAEVRLSVLAFYQADRHFTGDAAAASWFTQLRATIASSVTTATQAVGRLLREEATKHTEAFLAVIKRRLGIDVSATVRPNDVADYLQTAVDRNTSLITGLGDDLRQRIERVVYQYSIARKSVTELKKALVQEFNISDSRARTIARDQTGKFNADLNELRQRQAGISEYDWQTMEDDRVRPRHAAIDGVRYKWGQPTGAEDGLPPGQPINCRCLARAVIRWR